MLLERIEKNGELPDFSANPSSHDRVTSMSTTPIAKLEQLLIECLLPPEAVAQHSQGRIAQRFFAPYEESIRKLSKHYVAQSRTSPQIASNDGVAYALYFTPINFAKMMLLLEQIPGDFFSKPRRILDYGCGPGTASLALAEFLSDQQPANIVAADISVVMRGIAQRLLTQKFSKTKHYIEICTPTNVNGEFDLIMAANVFSEMNEQKQIELALLLCDKLTDDGVLIILEPALFKETRNAMLLRDILLKAHSELVPLFPCTRSDDCPMLAKEPENWCHGTLRWDEPLLTRQLDTMTGFNKHRIKYAGFVFQRNGTMRAGYRVLQEAVRSKRGISLTICGARRYGEILVNADAAEEKRVSLRRANQYDLLADSLVDE